MSFPLHNNLCEGFNGWILRPRCKVIYKILEEVRTMVMVRLHQQREECATWPKEFGYNIYKKN